MVDSTILGIRPQRRRARARRFDAADCFRHFLRHRTGQGAGADWWIRSGKTTISLAAMGYARPGCVITGGIVDLAGTDILSLDFPARRKLRGSDIAYVAQSAAASFNAALRLDLQVTELQSSLRCIPR